ncbi:MAG: hypothetical protein UT63_C0040G0006 [Candidatus Gottesmanbacteria bacterium GW2011_GWC2_39_8]|nr:MAG: hypothetical protein UT63_C0040G0006 [Candidatus Gottesmanbacteria bacterium GW2011_GWC2_39_8]
MSLEIIENKNRFYDLYQTIHSIDLPQPEPPEIDFNTEIVLAAFFGRKPTGGYSIEFGDAQLVDKSKLNAEVLTKEPLTGSILTQAVTSPYALASVKRGEIKEIVFLNRDGDILKQIKLH